MKRSYLEKVFFEKRSPDSLEKLKKQKNYGSRLYIKKWRKYFESHNPRRISDNIFFWKNIKTFFLKNEKSARR